MFPKTSQSKFPPELRLTRRLQTAKKIRLLFLLILIEGAKDFTAQGAPTDARRRFFQTSQNPIPHPDTTSLKKSLTKDGLNNEFMWISLRRPTQRATPQKPEEEIGVKKSSTAERPVDRRSGITAVQDSIESILNHKTHPNLAEARVTGRGNLESRILHDKSNLIKLYGKGTETSKRLLIPTYKGVAFGRDAIPHPPRERGVEDSSEVKRTLFTDNASKILQRKTLLYSEPVYRPTGRISTRKEVRTDPRQLISILGDPLPYKRSYISNEESGSEWDENMQENSEPWGNLSRHKHRKGAHRKVHFINPLRGQALRQENMDAEMQDTDAFYNKGLDEQLLRRDPDDHNMLEHLLEDNSPFFGTRDEKRERESIIKEIEKLTKQSSEMSKDYDFTDFPKEFSNMEVSEGELPSYDQIGDDDTNTIRKSKVSKNVTKSKMRLDRNKVSTSEKRRIKTGPSYLSSRPRPLKTKRSLRYHRHHHHRWRRPYLHVRSHHVSRYFDYPDEQEHHVYEDMPRLPRFPRPPRFMRFHRYPIAHRWPRHPISDMAERFIPFPHLPKISEFSDQPQGDQDFEHIPRFIPFHRYPIAHRWPMHPMSLMGEHFVPFPHLPKISEFSPQPLDSLEHLPPPPPIPPANMDREGAGNKEAEPVDEFAPVPEPIPEPEPPPIPELPFIKEIPPIAEPQEAAPQNLDPNKTFGTGESNGGVKKSSS